MAYRDDILADTPLAYFRLGEASGIFQDETANGYTATGTDITYGVAGAIAGDANNAVRLFQSSGWFYGRLATNVVLLQPNVDAPMSLEGWFHPLKVNGRNQPLIVQRAGATDEHALASIITAADKFGLRVGNFYAYTQYESTLTAVQGTWYHVVAVYDGTRCQLHVDGVEVLDVLANASSLGAAVTVGAFRNEGGMNGDFTYHFDGYVDEVALYQSALTEAQALAHNNSGRGIVPPIGTGTPSAAFAQRLARFGAVAALFKQATYDKGQASTAFAQSVLVGFGNPGASFAQAGAAVGQPTAAAAQAVYSLADFAAAGAFDVRVTLDGADVATLMEGISVNGEEGVARRAELRLSPAAGPINPLTWAGAAVTIDYIHQGVAWPRFRGIVDDPQWSPEDGILTLTCTDGLQQAVEALTVAQIDALTDGEWHPGISDPDATGWAYAQARMLSRTADLDRAVLGALRVTPWAAKATPDLTLTDDHVQFRSLKVRFPRRAGVTNRASITVNYNFQRLYQRDLRDGWSYGRTFCDYFAASSTLPSKDMIQSALDGTGWLVQSANYTPLWASQAFLGYLGSDPAGNPAIECGGGPYIWVNDSPEIVIGASWRLSRRWSQPVDEEYTIDVVAPESVAGIGEIIKRNSYRHSTEFDAETWEERQANKSLFAVATDKDAPSSSITSGGFHGTLENGVLNPWGDYQADKDDTDSRAGLLRTAIAIEAAALLDAHRETEVSVTTPLLPVIDSTMTIRIETTEVVAQGKVGAWRDDIDLRAGRAVTEVSLAISAKHGVATVADWDGATVPTAPQTLPAAPVGSGGAFSSASHRTQLGGRTSSPTFDDSIPGYAGNYLVANLAAVVRASEVDPELSKVVANWAPPVEANETEPGAEVYPVRFAVDTPEIEDALRDTVNGARSARIEIAIPDDEFTLIAP